MMSIVGGVGPRSFVLTIFLVRAPLAVLPFFEVAFNSLSFLFCLVFFLFFVSFISFFFMPDL